MRNFMPFNKKIYKVIANQLPNIATAVENPTDMLEIAIRAINKEYGTNISLYEEESKKSPLEWLKQQNIPDDFKIDKVLSWDCETTGYTGYMVSFGAVLFSLKENKILKEYYAEINPQCPIPMDTIRVHNITENKIQNAPLFKDIWPNFQEMLEGTDLSVGQNLEFDVYTLMRELERAEIIYDKPIFWFDTMKMGKYIANIKDVNGKNIKNPALNELIDFYNIKLQKTDFHNALTDSYAALEVFKEMWR